MSYERENVDSYDAEARPTRDKDVAVEELNDISNAGDYKPIPAVSEGGDRQSLIQPQSHSLTSYPSHDDVIRLESEKERLKKVNEEKNMVFDIIFNQLPDPMKKKLDHGLHEAKSDHEAPKFSELSQEELKRLTKWLVEFKPFTELEESQEGLPTSIQEEGCSEDGLSEPVYPQPKPEQSLLLPAPPKHSRGKKAVQRTNSVLGQGSHGWVTIVKHKGVYYAAKELAFQDPNYITLLYREAANLALLEHENIVPFCGIGVYEGDCSGCHLILTELLATSLYKYLMNAEDIHPGNKVSVLFDVVDGLQYMHQPPVVIHGDIKSNNILLTANGVAKVADLGSAKLAVDSSNHTPKGAPAYTAPEVCRKEFSEKVDVFAYSHLALVTLTRWEVDERHMVDVNQHATNKEVRRRKKLIDALKNPLLKKMLPALEECLSDEPNRRPTMEQLKDKFLFLDLPRMAPFVTIDTPVSKISNGTQTD